ncbi:MAG TPA: hypothetical protein VK745_31840 [Polyangiaceae bacterium]|jgi:hypothetical protein|nr:hypothetical protein [Polyangiaceae bacterium]
MSGDRLAALLDELVAELAVRVADKLKPNATVYFDQSNSPLGPRHHIAAVSSGKLPGLKLGRRYVATAADVEAYVRHSASASRGADEAHELDQLADELGLRKPNGDKT